MRQAWFTLCLLWALQIQAQDIISNNWTTDDGLPSSEVYCILQDRMGFLWIGTDNGLARFDGKTFKVYSTKDGLPENTVLRLTEDVNGKIWITTLGTEVAYIEKGQIKKFDFTFKKPIDVDLFEVVVPRGHDSSGRVWFNSVHHSRTAWEVEPGIFEGFEIGESVLQQHFDTVGCSYIIKKLSETSHIEHFAFTKNKNPIFTIEHYQTHLQIKGPLPPGYPMGNRFVFQPLSNGDYFGINGFGNYLVFDSKSLIDSGHVDVKDQVFLTQDQGNNVWVGSPKGILYFAKANFKSHEVFFPKYYITGAYKDDEGNYWFSDHNKGIRSINNLDFRQLNFHNFTEEPRISSVKVRNGSLWFSTIGGDVWRIDGNRKTTLIYSDEREPTDYYPFEILSNNTLLLSGGRIVKNGKILRPVVPEYMYKRDKCFVPINTGVGVGSMLGLTKYNSNGDLVASSHFQVEDPEIIHIHRNPKDGLRTNALLKDGDVLWMGTVKGLYVNRNDSIVSCDSRSPLLSNRIMALAHYDADHLLLGTKGMGLLVFNKKTNSVIEINQTNGLPSDMVRSVFVRNEIVYVGTNKGLSVLSLDAQLKIESLVTFDIQNALPSNEVNDISFFAGDLYLATGRGVVYVDPSKLLANSHPPPIYITQLKVNDSIVDYSNDTLELDKFHRNLTFSFNGIGFRSGHRMKYKYITVGVDHDTVFTGNAEARYTNLPPGNHMFRVWAVNEDGYWSKVPATMSFYIPKKFNETYWFIILIVLGSVGFITGILVLLYRRKQVKLDHELQTAELKQQALAALMNPHFVYNSLSAIQHFINTGDITKSNLYLSRFATLVRQNLISVREGFILVEDEIERLELYLNIEKMRFGDKLDYEVNYDPELVAIGARIPSMILQPFVENAIWHGILPKSDKGKVDVTFRILEDSILEVVIHDNGLGINKINEKNGKKHHTSMSMDITKERLVLLGKQTGKAYSIDITEIDKGGTQVYLKIPLN